MSMVNWVSVVQWAIPVFFSCVLTYTVFPKLSELFGSVIDSTGKLWASIGALFVGKLVLKFTGAFIIGFFLMKASWVITIWGFISSILGIALYFAVVKYILKADSGEAIPLALVTYATYSIVNSLIVLKIFSYILKLLSIQKVYWLA